MQLVLCPPDSVSVVDCINNGQATFSTLEQLTLSTTPVTQEFMDATAGLAFYAFGGVVFIYLVGYTFKRWMASFSTLS